MSKKFGLVAGWGNYPIVIAKSLQRQNREVFCLGIKGHADPRLKEYCHAYKEVGISRLGEQVRYFKRHGVTDATMAGKLFKVRLFQKLAWVKHFPDLTCFRYFYPHFISKTRDRADDSLMLTVIQLYADYGITFAPATDYVPEVLVNEGKLTKRTPSKYEQLDIQFGWNLAKEMGRLDIGQSVAVKGRAVLAVEAVEGTDQCIQRAGELCPAGGFTIVKVAKPDQDMRFDVPAIGIRTLQTMVDAGARVLAIEAGKTIVLEEEEVIRFANDHQLCIVARHNPESQTSSKVA